MQTWRITKFSAQLKKIKYLFICTILTQKWNLPIKKFCFIFILHIIQIWLSISDVYSSTFVAITEDVNESNAHIFPALSASTDLYLIISVNAKWLLSNECAHFWNCLQLRMVLINQANKFRKTFWNEAEETLQHFFKVYFSTILNDSKMKKAFLDKQMKFRMNKEIGNASKTLLSQRLLCELNYVCLI